MHARGPAALVLVVSCALCLLALELTLRAVLPAAPLASASDPLPADPNSLHYSDSIFSQHVLADSPHRVVGWGGAEYRINSHGYRGADFEWTKPPGAHRIAVYGGSSVFDPLQAEGEHWPARLEAKLRAAGFDALEVINAGVPGHASFDCVGRFLAEGHRLGADFVLLYVTWNDLKYFSDPRPIQRQYRAYRPERNRFNRASGRLDGALAGASHLYRHLRLRFLLWNHRDEREGRRPSGPREPRALPAQLEQFALDVATFVDVVRNAGAEPVLLTEARLVAAGNDETQRARIGYAHVALDHAALVAAYDAADAVIREVSRAKGVMLIDASPALSGRPELFEDHVHLSGLGSRELAELVAASLARVLPETQEDAR